jgi:hypothetical protein
MSCDVSDGYPCMFARMLDRPGVTIRTETITLRRDFASRRRGSSIRLHRPAFLRSRGVLR